MIIIMRKKRLSLRYEPRSRKGARGRTLKALEYRRVAVKGEGCQINSEVNPIRGEEVIYSAKSIGGVVGIVGGTE